MNQSKLEPQLFFDALNQNHNLHPKTNVLAH